MKRYGPPTALLLILLLIVPFFSAIGDQTLAQETDVFQTAVVDELETPPASELTPTDIEGKPPLTGGAISQPPPFVLAGRSSQDLTGTTFQSSSSAPAIAVWYGPTQKFGHKGDPQKWVNILGRVSPSNVASLTYSINGGAAQPLSIGPDTLRLAQAGDFNIELDYTDLKPGLNPVTITATDSQGGTTQAVVNVNYQGGGLSWPLQQYMYDWASVNRIDDIAQVVDGQWAIDNGRIYPTVLAYDRLVAIGDLTWRDYTVTVPVTFYGIDANGYRAPSNGPGVGILVRWAGHYDHGDGITPVHGWRRLGALAWYRWQRSGETYTEGLQLLGRGGRILDTSTRQLAMGVTYYFKLDIQSPASPTEPATYRFKVWPAKESEPVAWDFEKVNLSGEPSGGSILLLAHHVDAHFGPVQVNLKSVRPLPTLTVNTGGSGTGIVNLSPASGTNTYRFGEDVRLTAVASTGSTFEGWTGNLAGDNNPEYVEVFSSQSVTAIFANPDAFQPASDDFSDCSLHGRWTFVNPTGNAGLVMTGSKAQVSVPAGARHDYWPNNKNAPRIMQFLEDKDFEVDIKFDSSMAAQHQFQGLLVEAASNSFLRYTFQHDGTSYRIAAYTSVNNATPTTRVNDPITISSPMYLRASRVGNNWTLYYSSNGTNWTQATQFDFNVDVTSVGVLFGNAGSNPALTGLVDYFFNTDAPIDPQDNNRKLTLLTNGSGTVQATPQKSNYNCNESVTLQAIPAAGQQFVSWSGDVSGTKNPTTVVMNASKQVTANFAPQTGYVVNVTVNGSGTVTKSPDKPSYNLGESVTLTAVPAAGYGFSGWSGDLTGNVNPVVINVTSNQAITANFIQGLYLLQVTTEGQGTVSIDPPGSQFAAGTEVTLTANPAPGHTFIGWAGDVQGTTNPYSLIMNGDKTVKAFFTNDGSTGYRLYLPAITR
ncbi:MAG: InlB B-repeat-containing protein [Chloroflexota bacterium]